jgi:hypothetical protein
MRGICDHAAETRSVTVGVYRQLCRHCSELPESVAPVIHAVGFMLVKPSIFTEIHEQ